MTCLEFYNENSPTVTIQLNWRKDKRATAVHV